MEKTDSEPGPCNPPAPLPALSLWPAERLQGTTGHTAERDITTPADGLTAGRPVIRLTDVSEPTMTFYPPPRARETGTAVLVLPGGGYSILAIDLEGTEVCEWLNAIGVAAVLLKYRVPEPSPRTRPLEDAQRAMGIVRSRARDWRIDPSRIGVIGFSAGAHLAATLCSNHARRVYVPLDDSDGVSCRPDFAALIYPAYLCTQPEEHTLDPALRPAPGAPPAFLAQTQDDEFGVRNSVAYYAALVDAGVRGELHVYEAGGHGYGLRRSRMPVLGWPLRLAEWMKATKMLPEIAGSQAR